MPYPVGHRDKVRMKIVQAARRLFNRNGFENTSVNQIMAAAFTAISKAKATSMSRSYRVSSPTQTGKTLGRASRSS
jgi:hypothetical protein